MGGVCVWVLLYRVYNPALSNHLVMGYDTICPFGEVTKKVIGTELCLPTTHTHIMKNWKLVKKRQSCAHTRTNTF